MSQDTFDDALRVRTDEMKKIITDTQSSAITYVGRSAIGASTGSAFWQIQRRLTIGTQVTTDFADGGRYTQVWDDRNSSFPTPAFFNVYSTSFDGIDERVNFGNVFLYNTADQWSISMWVRPNNFGAQRAFYAKATNDANVFGWAIYHNTSGNILVSFRASGQLASYTGGQTLNALAWNHVCMTYNGNQNMNGVRVYVNNVLDTTPGSAAVSNNILQGQDANFGSRNAGFFYSGYMDEVGLWNKALSASEVSAVYNSGAPNDIRLLASAGNLQNYYRMGDGDSYPTILDNQGTDNGNMVNMSSANFVTNVP